MAKCSFLYINGSKRQFSLTQAALSPRQTSPPPGTCPEEEEEKTNRDVKNRSKYSRGKLEDSDDDVYAVICYVVLCSSEQALDNPADEKDVIVQRESDHYLSENGSLF
eukprot:COSAG06_NODE_1172_length_10425_cov_7.741042_6_plen_108_part_00